MLADVSKATVIIAYLFREGCAAVRDKLEQELPSVGSAVLSVGFSLRGWEPRWTLRVNGCVPLYFYSAPWREKFSEAEVAAVPPDDETQSFIVRIRDFKFHPSELRCKAGDGVVFVHDCDPVAGPQAHMVALPGLGASPVLSVKGDRWECRVPYDDAPLDTEGHAGKRRCGRKLRAYDPLFSFMTAHISVDHRRCPAAPVDPVALRDSYLASLVSELD